MRKCFNPSFTSVREGTIWRRSWSDFGRSLGRGSKQVKKALEKAERFQALFYQSLLNRGKQVLDQVGPNDKVMVIVGRPYNSCDSGVNLEIPKKLRDLGVLAIPMDFLPLESVASHRRDPGDVLAIRPEDPGRGKDHQG